MPPKIGLIGIQFMTAGRYSVQNRDLPSKGDIFSLSTYVCRAGDPGRSPPQKKKKEKKQNPETSILLHFTNKVLSSEKFYRIMNHDYDRQFQHTDWDIAWITNGLCRCVMLQISLIHIFSSLRVWDLCMPPLQVTLV